MMRGAHDLLSQIQSQLDGSWTITRTSCLGLCDRAPAALVRDSQVGPLQLEHMDRYEVGWCGEVSDYQRAAIRRGSRIAPQSGNRAGNCSNPPSQEVRSRRCKKPCGWLPKQFCVSWRLQNCAAVVEAVSRQARKWRYVASQSANAEVRRMQCRRIRAVEFQRPRASRPLPAAGTRRNGDCCLRGGRGSRVCVHSR